MAAKTIETSPEQFAVFVEVPVTPPGCGASIPMRGPRGETALFTVASRHPKAKFIATVHEQLAVICILAINLHAVLFSRWLGRQRATARLVLTNREKECLGWTARGKTSWETARILRISDNTVNFHLKNAVRKLDAANKCHAVAKAVAAGLIGPS